MEGIPEDRGTRLCGIHEALQGDRQDVIPMTNYKKIYVTVETKAKLDTLRDKYHMSSLNNLIRLLLADSGI